MTNVQLAAGFQPIATMYPAAWVGDFDSAGEAFLAAGCTVPFAAVAAYELERERNNVSCVDLAWALAEGGAWPEHPAWSLLNPPATMACVWPNPNGSFALFAGYAAKAVADESLMEGLIQEFQQATGLRWVAIVQTRMPWIAARVAQAAGRGRRGATE